MNNSDKIITAIFDWLQPVITAQLPNTLQGFSDKVSGFMGKYLGIDLGNYNVFNELGFLLRPGLDSMLRPKLQEMLSKVPDEQLPDMVTGMLDACIAQAEEKGMVNIFGVEINAKGFRNLKSAIMNNLKS